MTNKHPITPPSEVLDAWLMDPTLGNWQAIAIQAAQWGADQELEACVEWLGTAPVVYDNDEELHPGTFLRADRRPKPPSLKEQAQVELDRLVALISTEGALAMAEPIRRALEALDD